MNKDEIIDAVVSFTNELQPEHKYVDNPYPITTDDVDVGYCSRYSAKCGPRSSGGINYSVNQSYVNSTSTESLLRLMTHEVVHLSIGTSYNDPGHPPSFWRKFAKYADSVLYNWSDYNKLFNESLQKGRYTDSCIDDPNAAVVDGRSQTAYEVQEQIAHCLGCVPDEHIDGLGNTVVVSRTKRNKDRNSTVESVDKMSFKFEPLEPTELLKWTRKHNDVLTAGKRSWTYEPPFAKKQHGRIEVDPELAPCPRQEELVRASALYYYAQNHSSAHVYVESEDNSKLFEL
jgi:hypothetical protein